MGNTIKHNFTKGKAIEAQNKKELLKQSEKVNIPLTKRESKELELRLNRLQRKGKLTGKAIAIEVKKIKNKQK